MSYFLEQTMEIGFLICLDQRHDSLFTLTSKNCLCIFITTIFLYYVAATSPVRIKKSLNTRVINTKDTIALQWAVEEWKGTWHSNLHPLFSISLENSSSVLLVRRNTYMFLLQ